MIIKAIETAYKGYRFRSRLEARWAIAFDKLGIRYQYELEGFELPSGRYLPDFFLPFPNGKSWPQGKPNVSGYWLEIKPQPLTQEEESKLVELAKHTRHVVYCFAGDPYPGEFAVYIAGASSIIPRFHPPIECPMCDGSGIEHIVPEEREWRGRKFPKSVSYSCMVCDGFKVNPRLWMRFSLYGFACNCIDGDVDIEESFTEAFKAARAARFEFGETPE